MAHYVTLDENNIVISGGPGIDEDIILEGFEPELFYTNVVGKVVKRTSYNTRGGVHYQGDNNTPSIDQSKAFRKNYAGIGYYYDPIRDAFIPPKPFPSWTLNEESCLWDSPVPYPDTSNIPEPYIWYNRYFWNEDVINWVLQKPFDSWQLSDEYYYYISPTPYPTDGNNYTWNEETLNWELFNI